MAQGGMGRLVEELAGEALNNHLRNVRSYSELRRRVTEGALTDREVNEAYSRYARDHAADYRKEASDLTVRYYQELSELGARYSERFYEQILNGHGPVGGYDEPTPEPDDADLERVPIELHGRAGTEIVARFTLENTDPSPTEVRFRFEPCRAPHGEVFHAPITAQPAQVELEPGGKAEVLLRVALMPSVFVPGLIYRQTIIADGGRPLALDLALWIEADDEPAAASPVATSAPDPNPVADVIVVPEPAPVSEPESIEAPAGESAPSTKAAKKPSKRPAARKATKTKATTKSAKANARTRSKKSTKATKRSGNARPKAAPTDENDGSANS